MDSTLCFEFENACNKPSRQKKETCKLERIKLKTTNEKKVCNDFVLVLQFVGPIKSRT